MKNDASAETVKRRERRGRAKEAGRTNYLRVGRGDGVCPPPIDRSSITTKLFGGLSMRSLSPHHFVVRPGAGTPRRVFPAMPTMPSDHLNLSSIAAISTPISAPWASIPP